MEGDSRRRSLAFDVGRKTTSSKCADCHRQIRRIMQYITSESGGTFGVCFASLHRDETRTRDVWLDVILGTFGDRAPVENVTFGCHVAPSAGAGGPVISLVDAAATSPYQPVMGQRLTRERALGHPRLEDFWSVVDLMLVFDPDVNACFRPEDQASQRKGWPKRTRHA